MFDPMAGTSWTQSYLNSIKTLGITNFQLLTLPYHPPHPLTPTPSFIHATHDIIAAVKIVPQNPTVLAS